MNGRVIGYLRRSFIRHLVSPYGIALVPSCLFLFAWLLPPGVYTRYILEPDFLYRNMKVLVFFAFCVIAFLVGVRVTGSTGSQNQASAPPKVHIRGGASLTYLLVPLVLAGILCLIYAVLLAGSTNFIALLLSRRGAVVKQAITGGPASGYWGSTLFLLTGVLWWAAYRSRQLELRRNSKAIFYAAFLACFAIDVVTCLATFDRTNLMPLLAGSTLIYLFFKTRGVRVKLAKLVGSGLASGLAITGAFAGLQFARGASQLDSITATILGYTISSFNRLAALILGVAHYVYQGRGGYLVAFLTENERFHAVREQMGLPNSYQIWLAEFPALQMSGLNSAYNWAGVFGYLYSDIGWWTPLYLFAVGLIAGWLWNRFRAGGIFGIVLYPWMAFWILFWFGWNLLLDARGVVLIESVLLLLIYDKLHLLPVHRVNFPVALGKSSWDLFRPVVGVGRDEIR